MSRMVLAQTLIRRLNQLSNQEQKAVKEAVFNLQMDVVGGGIPRPGLRWHDLSKDVNSPNLYSLSANMDLRVIVYHLGEDYVMLYVDHHDAAYSWARRRRLEVHPFTGAMQVVEIAERTETVAREGFQDRTPPNQDGHHRLFHQYDAAYLLQLGVPQRYIETVRHASSANAHNLLEILPEDVSDRLLSLMSGELVIAPAVERGDPFLHPDARLAFVVADNEQALALALSGDWQEWMVFLHPSQRALVNRQYSGASRITGGAGTGKTVVALHRAARLARAGGRVLLTTYSRVLAIHLEGLMARLVPDPEVRARVTVRTVHALARQLSEERKIPVSEPLNRTEELSARLERAAQAVGSQLTPGFLLSEWRGVIEAQGVRDWDSYRETKRVGRGTALGLRQRRETWTVIEHFRQQLQQEGRYTWRTLCDPLTEQLAGQPPLFDHIVADEAQDFGPSELRFLLALSSEGPDRLTLALDEGQRIHQTAFPLKALDLDFRGRSARLKLNYRTSGEIRAFADRLLPGLLRDADGEVESRLTLSRFSGPPPEIVQLASPEAEFRHVSSWLRARLDDGIRPSQLAVFTRHDPALTLEQLQLAFPSRLQLVGVVDTPVDPEAISVSTMHRAKGLEFRAVALLGCDLNAMPSAKRLSQLSDPADQEDFIAQERHLFYVAATRARDHLLLTYSGKPSPFLPVTSSSPAQHDQRT